MKSKHPKIIEAYGLFAGLHSAQKYDHFHYTKHLEDVYDVAIEFGYTEDTTDGLRMLLACLGHDSLEDTAYSYGKLSKAFGKEVAEQVYCVTDELGRTREEKKEKTLSKTRTNPDSIILKLFDRIANIRYSFESKNYKKLEMYKHEYKSFRWALYVPGHCDKIWACLDELMVKNID